MPARGVRPGRALRSSAGDALANQTQLLLDEAFASDDLGAVCSAVSASAMNTNMYVPVACAGSTTHPACRISSGSLPCCCLSVAASHQGRPAWRSLHGKLSHLPFLK